MYSVYSVYIHLPPLYPLYTPYSPSITGWDALCCICVLRCGSTAVSCLQRVAYWSEVCIPYTPTIHTLYTPYTHRIHPPIHSLYTPPYTHTIHSLNKGTHREITRDGGSLFVSSQACIWSLWQTNFTSDIEGYIPYIGVYKDMCMVCRYKI